MAPVKKKHRLLLLPVFLAGMVGFLHAHTAALPRLPQTFWEYLLYTVMSISFFLLVYYLLLHREKRQSLRLKEKGGLKTKLYAENNPVEKKPLLLLAEDNEDTIKYLTLCLSKKYRLAIAKDGQDAMNTAFEIIPDLIITNVVMRQKNVYEACEKIKKDERTSHIPIIMLTSRVDLESKLEGLKSGADAYLIRPFNKKELLLRIEKLLELRERLQLHYRTVAGLSKDNTAGKKAPEFDEMENVFVNKVRQVIDAHFHDYNFTVENLCHEVGISHAQLHRKLSALTGVSANKFIRSVRLSKALELLQNPALSITTVAFDSGFNDLSYFGKVFKKEFGMTPHEWREQLRKEDWPEGEKKDEANEAF